MVVGVRWEQVLALTRPDVVKWVYQRMMEVLPSFRICFPLCDMPCHSDSLCDVSCIRIHFAVSMTDVRHCLSASLSACLFICVSVRPAVRVFTCLSICIPVC